MRRGEFGLNDSGSTWFSAQMLAVAEGYGVVFQVACSFEPTGKLVSDVAARNFSSGDKWDRTLKLVKDDVPIVGKIIDAGGNPVAGANVRVNEMWIPKAHDLSPWVNAVEKGEDYDVV